MKKNEPGLARPIRVTFGINLVVLPFTNFISGGLGIVALLIGAVLLLQV